MINSRIFGIVFVVVGAVASIMTVTTISLQNAMASVLSGFAQSVLVRPNQY